MSQLDTSHMFESHFLNWFQLLADMAFSVFSKASDNVPEGHST